MSVGCWQNDTAVLRARIVPVPLRPPQIPHELAWDWTWVVASLFTKWSLKTVTSIPIKFYLNFVPNSHNIYITRKSDLIPYFKFM